ncbi:hypothetical protein AB0J21_05330 [Streptomyces sp. NPDC049954]|uniref:hypothetical protein n=1 Tax=Streptomyces sp. NPDC049954 TaxID=3155779 RepID=UPI00341D26FD
MPQNVSVVQQIGVAAILVATAAWVVGRVRFSRRDRFEATDWHAARPAPPHGGIPHQTVPATEHVDLTPDERAAFAGLVRQLGDEQHG